jgi:hypothetical protein
MGSRRKSALKRLEGLQRQIEKHLRKIIDNQDSRDTEHWREEVRSWLSQMDRLLRHLGKKTAIVWTEWLAQARAGLEGKPPLPNKN